MRLDFAFFGSHATIRDDGTFDVLHGGWNQATSVSFPSRSRDLSLLARFSFDPNECGMEHECITKVFSPDGAILQPDLLAKMAVTMNKLHADQPNTFTMMLKYDGILSESPGIYRFKFFFGDFSPGEAILELTLKTNP